MISFMKALYRLGDFEFGDAGRYADLLKTIEENSVAAQAYSLLKESGRLPDLPASFRRRLSSIYEAGFFQNLLVKRETELLLRKLDEVGIAAIPLKGTVMAERFYGHFAARGTSDIDLLVKPERFADAIRVIQEAGYDRPTRSNPVHYHTEWMKSAPGLPMPLAVELHWSFVQAGSAEMNTEAVWTFAESMPGYEHIRLLSLEYTFYTLCLHGASHQMDSFKYVLDLMHMICKYGEQINLHHIIRRAAEDRTLRRVRAALAIVYRLVPELALVKTAPVRSRVRWWSEKWILSKSTLSRPVHRIRRKLFALSLLDRHRYRANQLFRWFAPSGELALYSIDDERGAMSMPAMYWRLYRQRFCKLFGGFSVRQYLGVEGMAAPLLRLLPYLKQYWALYFALLGIMTADIALTLFFTWFLAAVTDASLSGDIEYVQTLLLYGGGIVAANLFMVYYESLLENEAVNRVRRDLKLDLFDHMLQLPAKFFMKNHSGDLVSRLTNDIQGIEGAIGANLLNLIRMPLMALAAFVYLASIHWQLALLCLLLGPAALLTGGIFGKLIRDNGRNLQFQLGRVNSLLHDVFAGYSVVRSFAMEGTMARRYRSDCDEVLALERKNARLMGMLQAGSNTVSLASFFIGMGFGAYFVAKGAITVGSLLGFVSLIQHMLHPFSGIARQWGGLQRSLAAADRVWKVLDERPDRRRFPVYLAPKPLRDGIWLEGVHFAYEGRNEAVCGIDLFIPAGQTVALVGPSGAGKSTLFQLLMGFYMPDRGDIRLDQHSSRTTEPDLWRSYISFVPQEPYLFAGTIRDNIVGGREGASHEEIEQAAREANAHEFISQLPDGYDTWIGERGATLSGGQKQRITIARAILKDAPILLLDEATSSLDPETEAAVKEAISRLMKGRTTMIIAHRLSAVAGVERILVMNRGAIVEDGTHDSLIASRGLYAHIYMRR